MMIGYLDSKVSETKILTDDMKVSHHYYILDVKIRYTKQYTQYIQTSIHTVFLTEATALPASKHIKLSTALLPKQKHILL
jgi:hypothetical protein